MLYLAVEMPNKALCKPACATTVSIVQDADGKPTDFDVAPVNQVVVAAKPIPYPFP
jgi:hypothetical protein